MLRLGHDVESSSENGDVALDGKVFLVKDAVDLLADQVWRQESTGEVWGICHGLLHCFTLALIGLVLRGRRRCRVGHHRENVGH